MGAAGRYATSAVPIGAALVSCDGRPADELARTIVQAYHGLWSGPGARPRLAPTLFVDAGNPFGQPLVRCTWEVGDPEGGAGTERTAPHEWRPIDVKALRARLAAARGQGLFGFSMKVWRNRARGHHESYEPEYVWEGDMRDDDGLEAWLVRLGGGVER